MCVELLTHLKVKNQNIKLHRCSTNRNVDTQTQHTLTWVSSATKQCHESDGSSCRERYSGREIYDQGRNEVKVKQNNNNTQRGLYVPTKLPRQLKLAGLNHSRQSTLCSEGSTKTAGWVELLTRRARQSTLCSEGSTKTELLRQLSWLGRITHTQSKTEHSVF